MTTTRRSFLAAAAGAALLPAGCATTPVARLSAPADGRLVLDAALLARMDPALGALELRLEGHPAPILVLRDADGRLSALDARCTHLGCTVRAGTAGLSCPCHGAAFARDGSVRRGPAAQALATYPIAPTDDGGAVLDLGHGA